MNRVDAAEFEQLDLRCHAVLRDVPLHDVWTIRLHGGRTGLTILQLRALLRADRHVPTNAAVRALFACRALLGRLFRWDDERHDPLGASYIHRLSDAERSQSFVPPGSREGGFRVLYVLENEALFERRNATVHGFVAAALIDRHEDYTLYLAIYVKSVSRITNFYMALIDPFRRWLVYPALGRHVESAWLRRAT